MNIDKNPSKRGKKTDKFIVVNYKQLLNYNFQNNGRLLENIIKL